MLLISFILNSLTLLSRFKLVEDAFVASNNDAMIHRAAAKKEYVITIPEADLISEQNQKTNSASIHGTCLNNGLCIRQILNTLNVKFGNDSSNGADIIAKVPTDKLSLCLQGFHVISYDSQTQICCDGVVNKSPIDKICCGEKVVSTTSYICCNYDKLAESDPSAGCGITTCTSRDRISCNGTGYTVEEMSSGNNGCCGRNICNVTNAICCKNAVVADGRIQTQNVVEESQLMWKKMFFVKPLKNSKNSCDNKQSNEIVHEDEQHVRFGFLGRNGNEVDSNNARTESKEENNHTYVIYGIAGGSIVIFSTFAGVVVWLVKRDRLWTSILKRRSEKLSLIANPCDEQRNSHNVEDRWVKLNCRYCHFIQDNFHSNENTIFIPKCDVNVLSTHNGSLLIEECPNNKVNADTESFSEEDNWLAKQNSYRNGNFKSSLIQDKETQTLTSKSNRTIFGNLFDFFVILNEENNVVQEPHSEVKMIMPLSLTNKENVEVHWSSYSDINALNVKLGLTENEKISSPVVEFFIKGHQILEEHAVIEMPFIGSADELIVKTFESDEGVLPLAKTEIVQQRGKENQTLDMYYVVKDTTLLIYTRHFSGFYCVRRHKREDLQFQVFVFGVFRRINEEYTVALSVWVADKLFKFQDYKKRMLGSEVDNQTRKQIKDVDLRLSGLDLEEDDYIELGVSVMTETEMWEHRRHPKTLRQIYPEKQKFVLKEIAKRCNACDQLESNENEFPGNVEFSLILKDKRTPKDVFQCIIDMDVCREGQVLKSNPIFIESLELRQQDRLPVKHDGPMKYPVPEVGERENQASSRNDDEIRQSAAHENFAQTEPGDLNRSQGATHRRENFVTTGTSSATRVRGENTHNNFSASLGPRTPPSPELSRPCDSTQMPALPPFSVTQTNDQ